MSQGYRLCACVFHRVGCACFDHAHILAILQRKGTAFSQYERDQLGLRGLVPPAVKTLEGQVRRVLQHLEKEDGNVNKNLYLQDLHNRNETLYFKVLTDNIEMMAPLVYTPTVGDVCMQFGWQFRRTRGMYVSRVSRCHRSVACGPRLGF